MLITKLLAAGVLPAALAGCGSTTRHAAASPVPPAQCLRAQDAAARVNEIAQFFTSVTTQNGVVNADFKVAGDSAIQGSAQSVLDGITAVQDSASGSLPALMKRTAADFRALESDIAPGGDAGAVAQDATAAVADAGRIEDVCA
jgi:hypothetical protein